MFNNNPFAELSTTIAPGVIQTYVAVMIILVVAGTILDVIHKKSAKYFFDNWRNSKDRGSRQVGGAEIASLAVKTLMAEVLTSAEFCNARRRIAHLLTMYGFLAFAIATVVMVFNYPTPDTPAPDIWPLMWHIGALMVCVGGYWFWFFIRVDVVAEGNSRFRIIPADLFILSLLGSATMGLAWSWLQATEASWLFFVLYVIGTTLLFGTVPWSKFAHMFFKPAAALQKRVAEADGSRSNLPAPSDQPKSLGSVGQLPQNY